MAADSWTYVASREELIHASAQIAAGVGPFGVDTERASGFRYGNQAYLVQVYRREAGTFLIDPTEISDFSPLVAALTGDEWIFHAADQDLPSLAELGLVPEQIFDTELGSRLLGLQRVGLGAVTESFLGIALEKAHSAADWSTRPLPQPWLEYAALDVALLPDLRDAVRARLETENKWEFAAQEFAAILSRPPKVKTEEPWRKFAGGPHARSPRKLAIARELWSARDALAQELDVAPGRLIPDKSIIAAVEANPRSKGDLAALKTFRGRASRTELDRWWRAILKGKTIEDLPGPPPRVPGAIPNHRGWSQRYPEAAERLAELRAIVTAEAERQHMPVENLISPAIVRQIAWAPPSPPTLEALALQLSSLGARPWQVGLVAPILASAFVE